MSPWPFGEAPVEKGVADRKMRVLHFIHALSGGGAEKQLMYLTRASRGQEIHVAYADDAGAMSDYPDDLIFHRLPRMGNHSPMLLVHIIRLIKEIQPDVVQTWTLRFDVAVGVAKRLIQFVWVIRESNSYESRQITMKDHLRLRLGRKVEMVVANSTGGADLWSDHVPGAKVRVIHNGYDFRFLDSVVAQQDVREPASDHKYITYIGRLSPHKNVDLLVASFARIVEEHNARLTIIGAGSMHRHLEEVAGRLNVRERIDFRGYLPHRDAMVLLAGSDVLVLPSAYEGTPNVAMEAMYLGIPVVVSDTQAHRAFFSPAVVDYARIDQRDPEPLASAIGTVLSGVRSANTAVAREFASRWDMGQMAVSYADAYRDAISIGKRPDPG